QEGDRRYQTEVSIRSALAETLQAVGEFRAAMEQYEMIMARREKVYGPNHRSTQNARRYLLVSAVSAGDYARIIEMLDKNDDLNTTLLKSNGPLSLSDLNVLATAYSSSGRLDKALSIYAFLCEENIKKLGVKNQNTLASLHNRGLTYL